MFAYFQQLTHFGFVVCFQQFFGKQWLLTRCCWDSLKPIRQLGELFVFSIALFSTLVFLLILFHTHLRLYVNRWSQKLIGNQ